MSDGTSENAVERVANMTVTQPPDLYRLAFYVTMAFFLIVVLYPIYFIVILALTPLGNISNIAFFPNGFNPGVFVTVFQKLPFHLYVFNSVLLALMTTFVVLLLGSLAGYVFGRLEFRGRRPLLLGLLVISYFPPASFLTPLFLLFSGEIEMLGISSPDLLGTPVPIVGPLSALTLPFAIYILTTFFSQIPDGLEDAARIEGDTRLAALFKVIMPLSAPALAATGIITFIFVYNEFFFSMLMTSGSADGWSPVVWGILQYQGVNLRPNNLMAAASLVGMIPMALIVLLAQEKIVSGLTSGALKE
jgi:multiple sugar transport system permease protein